jgi:hypothetical protein
MFWTHACSRSTQPENRLTMAMLSDRERGAVTPVGSLAPPLSGPKDSDSSVELSVS